MIASFIVATAIILVDQLTKHFIYGMSCSLIGDFLWIESTLNKGASFGMLQNGRIFFIIMTIPVAAIMIFAICTKKLNNKFIKICLGIILGGTIGNFIDRVFIGGVRDFIYFKSINFAIFNVADMAITIGVIMLIIGLIVELCKKKKTKDELEKPKQSEGE